MRRTPQTLVLFLLLPALLGFEPPHGREALDRAFHNLYGADMLAAVELVIESNGRRPERIGFAYGRMTKGGETRTLLYTVEEGRPTERALLFQRHGQHDRMYVSAGGRDRVRPVSVGSGVFGAFDSDFGYEDLRSHRSDEYQIEGLGSDVVDGERTRVLRLRPLRGPYRMLLVWLSTERPVFLRIDYFDRRGLWKRYRADVAEIQQHFEWWVAMEDEMLDLRSGRRTTRKIKNIVLDTSVPDSMFSLTQLSRGRLPSF